MVSANHRPGPSLAQASERIRVDGASYEASTTHVGLAGYEALESDWRRITGHDHRYWIQYDFFLELLRNSVWKADDLLIVAHRDLSGAIVAIVPLRMTMLPIRRMQFRCAELIGSTFDDVSCQASSADFPAVSVDAAEQALLAVVRLLRRTQPSPSLLLLGRLAEQSRALHAALRLHRRTHPHVTNGGAKWLSTDRPFRDLQASLSGKFKISLRSCRRNLNTLGNVDIGVSRPGDASYEADFQEFLKIEASGWKGTGGTGTGLLVNHMQHQREFLQSVAFNAVEAAPEIHWMTLDGKCIASQFWMRYASTRVAFKIGYLEEFARFQPGHLLVEHILRMSCEDPEIQSVDFVSDAGWLDKWRAQFSPRYYHYLPVRPIVGRIADIMLRLPSREQTRHWIGERRGAN